MLARPDQDCLLVTLLTFGMRTAWRAISTAQSTTMFLSKTRASGAIMTKSCRAVALFTILAPIKATHDHELQATTTVSSVTQLREALDNAAVRHILVAAGTYTFTDGHLGCSGISDDPDAENSALCISRGVHIEAIGVVVLKARADGSVNSIYTRRRVMYIGAGGASVVLVGLKMGAAAG